MRQLKIPGLVFPEKPRKETAASPLRSLLHEVANRLAKNLTVDVQPLDDPALRLRIRATVAAVLKDMAETPA